MGKTTSKEVSKESSFFRSVPNENPAVPQVYFVSRQEKVRSRGCGFLCFSCKVTTVKSSGNTYNNPRL